MMNDTSSDETVNLGPDFDKQVRQEGHIILGLYLIIVKVRLQLPAKNFF